MFRPVRKRSSRGFSQTPFSGNRTLCKLLAVKDSTEAERLKQQKVAMGALPED